MSGRYLISFLTLAAAITVSASWAEHDTSAQGHANAPNQATGSIGGEIKLKSGLGFVVSLSMPGADKPTETQSVDYLDHGGKFLFEMIQPGSYRLDISSFEGCGVLPWSKMIAVNAGETVHVKAKIKVNRHAVCE
jgi:hypothetical protein